MPNLVLKLKLMFTELEYVIFRNTKAKIMHSKDTTYMGMKYKIHKYYDLILLVL